MIIQGIEYVLKEINKRVVETRRDLQILLELHRIFNSVSRIDQIWSSASDWLLYKGGSSPFNSASSIKLFLENISIIKRSFLKRISINREEKDSEEKTVERTELGYLKSVKVLMPDITFESPFTGGHKLIM